MEARDVLKRPVITEKFLKLWQKINTLLMQILVQNKTQVKIAVEEIFDVKVDSVNIINYKPKKKRMGRYQGYTNKRRKAIVKLKEGSIDLFN